MHIYGTGVVAHLCRHNEVAHGTHQRAAARHAGAHAVAAAPSDGRAARRGLLGEHFLVVVVQVHYIVECGGGGQKHRCRRQGGGQGTLGVGQEDRQAGIVPVSIREGASKPVVGRTRDHCRLVARGTRRERRNLVVVVAVHGRDVVHTRYGANLGELAADHARIVAVRGLAMDQFARDTAAETRLCAHIAGVVAVGDRGSFGAAVGYPTRDAAYLAGITRTHHRRGGEALLYPGRYRPAANGAHAIRTADVGVRDAQILDLGGRHLAEEALQRIVAVDVQAADDMAAAVEMAAEGVDVRIIHAVADGNPLLPSHRLALVGGHIPRVQRDVRHQLEVLAFAAARDLHCFGKPHTGRVGHERAVGEVKH